MACATTSLASGPPPQVSRTRRRVLEPQFGLQLCPIIAHQQQIEFKCHGPALSRRICVARAAYPQPAPSSQPTSGPPAPTSAGGWESAEGTQRQEQEETDEPFLEDGSDPNTVLMASLPEANFTRVQTAEYVTSSVDVSSCPPPRLPEFAVIGRSNVGKSSLINMLTNSRGLARVSKEPGKTRCINHFIINDSWYLVDLPGYGYARTGFATRRVFDSFTRDYFLNRRSLALVYLLVDSSISVQDIDVEYAGWLHKRSVPYALVFTKADKRKKGQAACRDNVASFLQRLQQVSGAAPPPPVVVTSAASGLGRTALLHLTSTVRDSFAATTRLQDAMREWQASVDDPKPAVPHKGPHGPKEVAPQGRPNGGHSTGAGKKPQRKSMKGPRQLPGDDIPLPPRWKVRAMERDMRSVQNATNPANPIS